MRLLLLTITGLSVLAGMALLLASGARSLDRDEALLYERLGGEAGVEIVVDDFLAKVGDDDWLSARFAGTDMPRLRAFLIERVCEATDGPCHVDGIGLPDGYEGMGITDYELGLMTEYFAEAMSDAGVDTHGYFAAMHLLVDMHDEIVRR